MQTLSITDDNKVHLSIAAKAARTKVENTGNEIRQAITELKADGIKPSQANVIRKLKGKRCKKTIIQHWKILFPKQRPSDANSVKRDAAQQTPLEKWSNTELGIPTLKQEIKSNPGKSPNALWHFLQVMRENRIQELRRLK